MLRIPSRSLPAEFAELTERFPEREVERLAQLTTVIEVSAGRILMREGEPGSEAMLVLGGTLAVTRGDEAVATIGAGQIVGEHSLIALQPRNANVEAITDAKLAVMSRSEFASVLDACPDFGRHVLDAAVDRLATRA